MNAASRVLVGYASAAGSTRGIAERIADRIRTDLHGREPAGPEVICRPAGPDLAPDDYDALIIGSAVHSMAWLPAATSFLDRAAATAAPVWVFSVGSVEPRGRITRMMIARERTRIEQTFPAGFTPRDHRVFGGTVVMTGLPLWARVFWRLIGGKPGDHRDWPVIERWAADIATELAGRQSTVAFGGPPGAPDDRARHLPQPARAASADRRSGGQAGVARPGR